MIKEVEEEFRDIPGYDGLYQVSNLGRVKSLPREVINYRGSFISKERIMKQSILNVGYYIVGLRKDNKSKVKTVHSLVASAFLNHVTDKTIKIVIDHIDNNPLNNRLENLQIISQRENSSKDRNNCKSIYTGVSWNMFNKKWQATILLNRKQKHLGYFKTELEASEYYQNALKSIENNNEIVVKKANLTSNFRGVSKCKVKNIWVARMKFNKKYLYLGGFKTELEAHNAYQNKLSEINSKLN